MQVIRKFKAEKEKTMNNESTKEFRVNEYVHLFEKSLNYIAGAIFSIFAAGITYVSSNPNLNLSIKEIFQIIDNDPKEFFCILAAVLSTLPYYFYYTLKDNTDWNACNGSKDNWGLLKIYVLYEIGIFSFFYLILQGDIEFTLSKLIISIINIILISIYIVLMIVKNKSGERIGYFTAVIVLAALFFIVLLINSCCKLSENSDSQSWSVLLLLLLFSCNAGLNIFFLSKWDSNAEIGIISNRIKIMIPVISISIYTVSIIYCFLVFENNAMIMLMIALWITLYEVAISCIRVQASKSKVIQCIISFAIFVFGLPVILKVIGTNMMLPDDLSLNWLILIGISIYISAIKYWGYILKFLFIDAQKNTEKIMSVMIWYRNSILGSMLFVSVTLISSERHYILLISILLCSIISEYFIYRYFCKDDKEDTNKDTNKIYKWGKLIEFIAIIIPISVIALENYFNFDWTSYWKVDQESIPAVFFAVLGVMGIVTYIERKWHQTGNRKDSASGQLPLPNRDAKQLWMKILESIRRIKFIDKQILPDKDRGSFITILLSWSIYIAITAVVLDNIPLDPKYRILGLIITIIIVLIDWTLISKYLLDHYIIKIKEGKRIIKFINSFQSEWKKCLETLKDFDEINAKQFQIGDRLRPYMFFLGSTYKRNTNLTDDDYRKIAKAACSVELIHKASVMFDDYIDDDNLRRGEKTFHKEYSNSTNTMILLGNAMLAQAQINFAACRDFFECDDRAKIVNSSELAQIIVEMCTGCYKELSRADYDAQDVDSIKKIIDLETVSLIKRSIGLGYRCFHDDQGHEDRKIVEKLGESFGYVFQYLNDLEPFSQKSDYERHKGTKTKFDKGKKNIALITLYNEVSPEEKEILKNANYDNILQLYQKYETEQKILEMVNAEINKIKKVLGESKPGNEEWKSAFKALFNYALEKKGWKEKITSL